MPGIIAHPELFDSIFPNKNINITPSFQKNKKDILNLKNKIFPYLHKLEKNSDKILVLDICKLLVYSPSFSDELIEKTTQMHQQLNQTLHEGRDKLLEYNSCRQPEADRLKQVAEQADTQSTLFDYMDNLFDAFGIEHSEHSEHCYILTPGEHMINQFPGLPDDGMTITYDRAIALANEDMQFFTWEHPMVKSAMEMVSSSEIGNTAMTTLEDTKVSSNLKPGSLLVECLFMIETTAHEVLQANRYLPPTLIRIVIDEYGQDHTNLISHSAIQRYQSSEAINTETAQQIVKMKEENLRSIISTAESLCQRQAPDILQAAREASQETLLNEITRLNVLAQVNPNIRDEEIDFFSQQLSALDEIFDSVSPRLDALRVIIMT